MFKNKINYLLIALFILLLIIIIGYLLYINFNLESKKSMNIIKEKDNAKICMTVDEYKNLLDNKTNIKMISEKSKEDTIERDRKVLDDDLYPPLNRGDTVSHTRLANNINNRKMYINTQETGDTYRLVAYVSSTSNMKDSGNIFQIFI